MKLPLVSSKYHINRTHEPLTDSILDNVIFSPSANCRLDYSDWLIDCSRNGDCHMSENQGLA